MKPIYNISICIFLVWIIILLSCKKDLVSLGELNKSPIANAGPDQSIQLPLDTIVLDGSASRDPDGLISQWIWTKISGPFSSTISKPTDSITNVKALVTGTYRFELKVTDNGGLSAKDTINVLVDSTGIINHAPEADGGGDQTIFLPTNTANLDGSGSTDPDHNIISYVWTKIAGPSSFKLVHANSIQTEITDLTEGAYKIELTVTDAGGLFSKDTINIIVTFLTPAGNVDVIGCNATMTPYEHLPSAGGVVHTAAAGNKILFVRYTDHGVVDIYDTITHAWETVSNMNSVYSRSYNNNATTIGNKIIFSSPNYTFGDEFNGQLINIYNAASNSWTTSIISEGRGEQSTRAVAGSKVYYAGGQVKDSPFVSKKIDVYDASSGSWTSENFPNARIGMKAVSFGNKIYFAGGFITRYDSLGLACDDFGNNCDSVPTVVASDRIDIWDVSSNTWSLAQLCEPRGYIATTVVGNKIVFASGQNNTTTSAKADIYNAATNTWTSATLAGMNNSVIDAYSVGNKVLVTYLGSDKIDIYNALTDSWSTAQMPLPLVSSLQERSKGAVLGNKIVFYTIYDSDNDSKNVEMYDASTNTWCHAVLSKRHVRAGVISYGNRIYIAGGFTDCCSLRSFDTVWFFNF